MHVRHHVIWLSELESEIAIKNGESTKTEYQYKNQRIKRKIIRNENGEIIESQTFYYGKSGLADSVKVFRNGISTMEINSYNSQNQLIGKSIKSTTNLKLDYP